MRVITHWDWTRRAGRLRARAPTAESLAEARSVHANVVGGVPQLVLALLVEGGTVAGVVQVLAGLRFGVMLGRGRVHDRRPELGFAGLAQVSDHGDEVEIHENPFGWVD